MCGRRPPLRWKFGESLGKQAEQRCAQQRTHGVAHEPRNQPRSNRFVEEQEGGCDEQAPEAAEEAQPQGCRE